MNEKIILKVEQLNKEFASKGVTVKAVSNVSFEIEKGKTLGIVGESGCGKTTLGRAIVRGIDATSGKVMYQSDDGELDFLALDKKELRKYRKDIQMIFQDPYSSLDPRMTVFEIISEPLLANYKLSKQEVQDKVNEVAAQVGLNVNYLRRYPHAFSGGQRQRIGIARALILNPKIIICDEAVSALDVSIQAQIINLLEDLQKEYGLTYLFISHALSVVRHISDYVMVMYLGKVVEYASKEELFSNPMHPYTQALLSAAPQPDPDVKIHRIVLQGEVPNPANPPSGCYFHTRCPYATERCKKEAPELQEINQHKVACFRCQESEKGKNHE